MIFSVIYVAANSVFHFSSYLLAELSEHTWVSLTTPSPSPVVCVGVPHDIMLPVHNVTDHWLLCGLELGEVKLLGEEEDEDYQCAVVRLPSKRVLMDPNNCKEAKVEEK
jgi:hypothetical protein